MGTAEEKKTGGTIIISVSASSKKAGKSRLASHLVRGLNAEYAIKVSGGGRHSPGRGVITDPGIISRPGTDTGALVEAGAGTVMWVCSEGGSPAPEMAEALSMLPPGGVLVIEGNSALLGVDPDLAVFLMSVPFDEFKESAPAALARADLVIIDMSGKLAGTEPSSLEGTVREHNDRARVRLYATEEERLAAFDEVLSLARAAPGPRGPRPAAG